MLPSALADCHSCIMVPHQCSCLAPIHQPTLQVAALTSQMGAATSQVGGVEWCRIGSVPEATAAGCSGCPCALISPLQLAEGAAAHQELLAAQRALQAAVKAQGAELQAAHDQVGGGHG